MPIRDQSLLESAIRDTLDRLRVLTFPDSDLVALVCDDAVVPGRL
jgi:hypothetical protein